jgi:hypothetical protein
MTNANNTARKFQNAEEGELQGFVRIVGNEEFDFYMNGHGHTVTYMTEDADEEDVDLSCKMWMMQPVEVIAAPIIAEMEELRRIFKKLMGGEVAPAKEWKIRYYDLLRVLIHLKAIGEEKGQQMHNIVFKVEQYLQTKVRICHPGE